MTLALDALRVVHAMKWDPVTSPVSLLVVSVTVKLELLETSVMKL